MVENEARERTRGGERAPGTGTDGYEEDRHDVGGEYLDEGGFNEEHGRRDPGNPLWDEALIATLLVGGVVLVLVPEPSTSGLGLIMLAVGAVAWVVDAVE